MFGERTHSPSPPSFFPVLVGEAGESTYAAGAFPMVTILLGIAAESSGLEPAGSDVQCDGDSSALTPVPREQQSYSSVS